MHDGAQGYEVSKDADGNVVVTPTSGPHPGETAAMPEAPASLSPKYSGGAGAEPPSGGCTSKDEMAKAARAAGQSEILDRYAADYPVGPHDQPQSMCPAFGSLRVGLRMKRVATVLSGSACCVYGLTFVSHFYGARRSVGYVPFNSET